MGNQVILDMYVDQAVKLKQELREIDAQISDARDMLKQLFSEAGKEGITPRQREEIREKTVYLNQYIEQCQQYSVSRVTDLKKRISERHPDVPMERVVEVLRGVLEKA